MTGEVDQVKQAQRAARRALKAGELTYPDACQRCGQPGDDRRLDVIHLYGYEPYHALDVVFWCRPCSVATQRARRDGELANPPLTKADRRRYAELLDEVCAELRFRTRAVGLRQTDRDWLADRYVPQRALVGVLCHLLDAGEPDRRDLDVLFRAVEVLDRYAPEIARAAAVST